MSCDSHPIPPVLCRVCGYFSNRAAQFLGEAGPQIGDLSICFNCGTPSLYDETMELRPLSEVEVATLGDEERRLIRFCERNCYMRRHAGQTLANRGGKA